jgi:hypothetical protein
MVVVLAAFWLGSRLIQIEYKFHRKDWEEDGKPADVFWPVPGSYLARMAVSTSWILATPDWMKSDRRALRMVLWYRVLLFIWIVGWIAMAVLSSAASQ